MHPQAARNILQLPEFWTKEELTSSFRSLAKANHPDLGGDHIAMKQINAAYATLIKMRPPTPPKPPAYTRPPGLNLLKNHKLDPRTGAYINTVKTKPVMIKR